MIKFDVVSIFPEFFDGPLSCGTLRIGQKINAIRVCIINPRKYAKNGVVDDYQFGGGAGMVLKSEPLFEAINSVRHKNSLIINLTPKGEKLSQCLVNRLTTKRHIIIICGRYKGIDERINLLFNPWQISIGDYILSGGEIGALVLMESITRLLPNVMGNKDSWITDSFQENLLEPPIYTRPKTYKNYEVPQVLREGNHAKIKQWRQRESLKKTIRQRPDLMATKNFSKEDFKMLMEVIDERNS